MTSPKIAWRPDQWAPDFWPLTVTVRLARTPKGLVKLPRMDPWRDAILEILTHGRGKQWVEVVFTPAIEQALDNGELEFSLKPPRPVQEYVPRPSPKPAPAEIPSKHKSPEEARAHVHKLRAAIKAYQDEHECSQERAADALHQELGHASGPAVLTAISRGRKLFKGD